MSSCWSNHRYVVVWIESKRRLPPLSNQFRHLMCFDVMWFHTPSNRLTSPLSDDFSVFFWFLARSTVLGFILFANGWFETMNLARVWLKMMRDLRTFDCLRLLANQSGQKSNCQTLLFCIWLFFKFKFKYSIKMLNSFKFNSHHDEDQP
jgi:hypothetical protein